MALIDKTGDPTKTICWGRGDTKAKGFAIQTSAGVARNITGSTFKLTVNSEKDPPTTANEQFTINGVITDAVAGEVGFAPAVGDTDITPDTYFYDIQETDPSGADDTLIKAKALIVQDITKV